MAMTPLLAEVTYIVSRKERSHPGVFGQRGANATAYGLFNTAFAGGLLVGPLWGGFVMQAVGWGTMGWTLGVLALAGGTVAALVGGGGVGGKGVWGEESEGGGGWGVKVRAWWARCKGTGVVGEVLSGFVFSGIQGTHGLVKGEHGRMHTSGALRAGSGWYTSCILGLDGTQVLHLALRRLVGWLGGWHIDFSLDLVGGFPLYLRFPSFLPSSV